MFKRLSVANISMLSFIPVNVLKDCGLLKVKKYFLFTQNNSTRINFFIEKIKEKVLMQ